jgi:O-antigen/teichoic acid export membrane protein
MRLPLGNKDTLIGRASRALGWSFISTALVRFGTLGIGIVLARLLGPHAFGTYAVALVALLAVLSFNELGVSLAIVRWPGDPREIAPTVATIACVSSLLLYVGFFLGAPAFSTAMGAPAATPVVRVLATSILINCVVSVPAAMLQRSFRQDRKMIADQVHSWLGAAVSIGLAWAGFGAMSLAIGSVAGALAGGIVIAAFSPPPRFGFDVAKARALLVFGLPLAGSSFIVFLAGNVDNVVVGHMLGATALGFYVLAWNLSSWPVAMFSLPVRAVAPALFSRLQHDRAAMHAGFVSGVGLLASVTLPVCLLISGSAVPLVRFVYGPRWVPAAQALSWLALLAALRILFELSYDYFVVLARSRVVFTVQLAWLLALIPALIVGVHTDGIRGAAIAGFVVAACVVLPWYLSELHKVGIRRRAIGAQLWMPVLGATGVGLFAVGLGGVLTNNLVLLMVSGVVALGAIGLLVFYVTPDLATLRSVFADAGEPGTAAAGAAGAGRGDVTSEPDAERVATAVGSTMPPAMMLKGANPVLTLADTISAIEITMPLPVYRESTGPLPIFRDTMGPMPTHQAAAVLAWPDATADPGRSHDHEGPSDNAPQVRGLHDSADQANGSRALADRWYGASK